MLKRASGLIAAVILTGCQLSPNTTWELEAPVTDLVQAHINDSPTMGFAVAVWHNGAWRMQKGWGYADAANHVRATADTQFRTASISKGITAVLSFSAAQQNLAHLNQPVSTQIPTIDRHRYSLGDLLTNRSGTCHYDEQCDHLTHPDITFSDKHSFKEAAINIAQQPLSVAKGTVYYSTHAYTIAAMVLENATATSYQTLLDETINTPLNTNIHCEDLQQKNPHRAKLYQSEKGLFEEAQADNISWKCPGGGMQASVKELIVLGKALRDGTLLNKQSLNAMITPPDTQIMGNQYFAHGWAVPTTPNTPWFGKRGDQLGGRAYLRVYTSDDLVIAVAGNTLGPGAPELTQNIADLILKQKSQ